MRHPLHLVLACVLLGLACATEDEARLCAGVQCSAGICVVEDGEPTCHCSAFDQVAGRTCKRIVDPDGNSLQGAQPLEPGAGALEADLSAVPPVADVDYFAFDALDKHIYALECVSPVLSCEVTLRDSTGKRAELTFRRFGTLGTTRWFWELAAGRYVIEVRATEGSRQGRYTLRLDDSGPDDFTDYDWQAEALPPAGEVVRGNIQFPDDTDRFKLAFQAGHAYRVTCTSDVAGNRFVFFGAGANRLFRAESDSTPLLSVWSNTGTTGSPGSVGRYTCAREDLGVDDFPDSQETPSALDPSSLQVEGRFDLPTDKDVFSFDSQANRLYAVRCEQTGGPAACELPNSTWYATALECGANASRFTITTQPAAVSWWQPSTYRLVVEDRGPEDHGDDEATASALAVGATVQGLFECKYDVDYFAFPVTAGTTYRWQTSAGGVFSQDVGAGFDCAAPNAQECVARASGTGYIHVYNSQWQPTYTFRVDAL